MWRSPQWRKPGIELLDGIDHIFLRKGVLDVAQEQFVVASLLDGVGVRSSGSLLNDLEGEIMIVEVVRINRRHILASRVPQLRYW